MPRQRILAATGVILLAAGGWGLWRFRASTLTKNTSQTIESSTSPEDDITGYGHFNAPGLDQIQVGESIYADWCEACHADTGLGLTADWLAQWDPEHQNCWQAKCHSTDHPSDGFVIPRLVPPVVGPTALSRFETASDLHIYLKDEMPYAEKGVLDDLMYWALTANLLDRNDISMDTTLVGPGNAALIRLGR
jgi:cytochrome c5